MLSNHNMAGQSMIFPPRSTSVCGQVYTLDNAMICKQGGFVIQRHNELRVLDIEHGTLTSLIFTTTGRMSDFDKNKI